MIFRSIAVLLLSSMFIISCSSSSSSDDDDGGGGGGGTGGTDATVEITDANAAKLVTVATEGSKQAVSGNVAPTGLRAKSLDPVAVVTSFPCSQFGFGGTGNVITDFDDAQTMFTITYECTQFNGVVSSSFSPDILNWTSYTTTWDDFQVSGQGFADQTLDGEVTCTRPDSTSQNITCNYAYAGIDGLDGGTYTVSNVSVSGSNFSGYSISGTASDPDTGAVTFTSSGLTFNNCTYGVPNSGSMTINGTNGTQMTVTFDSCDSFTVTIDDVATTYNWADLAA